MAGRQGWLGKTVSRARGMAGRQRGGSEAVGWAPARTAGRCMTPCRVWSRGRWRACRNMALSLCHPAPGHNCPDARFSHHPRRTAARATRAQLRLPVAPLAPPPPLGPQARPSARPAAAQPLAPPAARPLEPARRRLGPPLVSRAAELEQHACLGTVTVCGFWECTTLANAMPCLYLLPLTLTCQCPCAHPLQPLPLEGLAPPARQRLEPAAPRRLAALALRQPAPLVLHRPRHSASLVSRCPCEAACGMAIGGCCISICCSTCLPSNHPLPVLPACSAGVWGHEHAGIWGHILPCLRRHQRSRLWRLWSD